MSHNDVLKQLFPLDFSGSCIRTGNTTSLLSEHLVDSTVDFLTSEPIVHVGDIVTNTTLGTQATVNVVNDGQLSLSQDIFTSLGQGYQVECRNVFVRDITLEGQHLDNAQSNSEDLLEVMFLSSKTPEELETFVSDWERVFDIIPGADDTAETRKNRVLTELRKVGGLSKPYFVALAAAMGYDVTITDNIEEFRPFMTGWARAADRLYAHEVIWIWKVHATSRPMFYFEAGMAEAGDYLLTWDSETKLENLFNELKPAHTYVLFDYS